MNKNKSIKHFKNQTLKFEEDVIYYKTVKTDRHNSYFSLNRSWNFISSF